MKIEVKELELARGETISYREAGQGEKTLVLIHGNQSSSIFFRDLMGQLEGLKIYAVDLAGFGDSSYNRRHNSLGDWAQDLEDFMEELGLENAIVVGWSLGGGVAMELAANYPKRVGHLVLLASVSVKGFPLYRYGKNNNPILTEPIYKREDIAQDPVLIKPVLKAFEDQNRQLFKTAWKMTIFNIREPEEEVFEEYITAILKERCFLDASVALAQFNITKEDQVVKGSGAIDRIDMPVTWIHGDKDLVVPVAFGIDSMKYFKHGSFKLIKNAGHAMFLDRPEEFRKLLEDIIKNS